MKSESNLEKLLSRGEFVVTAELGPPKGANINTIINKVKILKGFCDAVNITDNQTSIVRMSSIASAIKIIQLGMEPIIQMVTRDRNRIALQSDLIGAAALGVKNVLCLTGDHQSFGNHPSSKNVFDVDSIQLVKMFKDMRDEHKFQCGEEMKHPPEIFIGAAANPFADPFDFRPIRLAKKVNAGVDFIQTQLVYNIEKFKEYMKKVREMGLHKKVYILAGVGPIKSVGMAKYMQKNVAGMDVPDKIVERLKKSKDAKEEGINICVDIIQEIKEIEGVSGVHIMAIAWEEAVPIIVEKTGLLPRPKP
ncbi:MAG: methylenetetrahydrofolate reductase [Actinobacteria bacterium]|nr:methylenetetrahydrofolate reductase [Actinomycetota bacterium]